MVNRTMISLCAVIIDGMEQYLQVFQDMLRRYGSNISEVLIAKTDERDASMERSWTEGQIKFTIFGSPLPENWLKQNHVHANNWCGHAFGLHAAMERAKEDYIMLSDIDLFFCKDVGKLYVDLMEKHDLFVIGVSHFNRGNQCYLDFPCIINCLLKKKDLPDDKFLYNALWVRQGMRSHDNHPIWKCNGKWLIPGMAVPTEHYPNPRGLFDAGCNLWVYTKVMNGRWLSFVELNGHHYRTNRVGCSFELKEDLGNDMLLFHRSRGARHEEFWTYLNRYQKMTAMPFPSNGGLRPGELLL